VAGPLDRSLRVVLPLPTAASISGDAMGSPFCGLSAAAAAATAAVADALTCPPLRDVDLGPIASKIMTN
jgi:hypothetical protein